MDPIELERRRQEGLEIIRRARAAFGPDPLEETLKTARALPDGWCRSPAEDLASFRQRFWLRQKDLARKAGLTRTQIVRLENGRDALLSTWRKAYAALGFELLVVPLCRETLEELEELRRRDHESRHGRGKRRRTKLTPIKP